MSVAVAAEEADNIGWQLPVTFAAVLKLGDSKTVGSSREGTG